MSPTGTPAVGRVTIEVANEVAERAMSLIQRNLVTHGRKPPKATFIVDQAETHSRIQITIPNLQNVPSVVAAVLGLFDIPFVVVDPTDGGSS